MSCRNFKNKKLRNSILAKIAKNAALYY